MDYLIFLVIVAFVVGIIALLVSRIVSKGQVASEVLASPLPAWVATDDDPGEKEGHALTPGRVEHALDLDALKYRVLSTWYNDQISAESDTSVIREEFDVVRDDDSSWRIRLAMRNGTVTKNPVPRVAKLTMLRITPGFKTSGRRDRGFS